MTDHTEVSDSGSPTFPGAPVEPESTISIDGYVIVPPLNPWDEKAKTAIYGHVSARTFSLKASDAWGRMIGYQAGESAGDTSYRIQAWFDKGYRLKEATLIIKE